MAPKMHSSVAMEDWALALVILVAVLVGAALPALIQLRATLREMQKSVKRIDGLVMRLEAGGRVEQLVEDLASVSRSMAQLRDTVRVAAAVGAAVGPALAAAIHAFQGGRSPPASEDDAAAEVKPESRK